MSRRCSQCGATYDDLAVFCPEDGVRLGAAPPEAGAAGEAAGESAPLAFGSDSDDDEATIDEEDDVLGRSIGSYRVTQLLGKGGMGGVYLAEHPIIGSKVAIKFLHPRFSNDQKIIDRFFNEARAVNVIGHDNILKILDLNVTEDGRHYFIMELLQGASLQSLVADGRPVPLSIAGPILTQFCEALQAAHDRHITHRDVKPENIYLVTHKGRKNFVKVVDFGVAKLHDGAGGPGLMGKTQTGMVIGTPAYMSPEQAGGLGHKIDGRSDVYSAGVMMFQLATGRLPFPGTNFGEVLIGHMQLAPPDPRELNREVSEQYKRVILKALAKRQEDRFQSMRELSAGIQASMEALGIPNELPLADGEVAGRSGESSHMTPGFATGTPAPRRPPPQPRFGAAEVVPPPRALPRRSGRTLATRMEAVETQHAPLPALPRGRPKQTNPLVIVGVAAGAMVAILGLGAYFLLSGGDHSRAARMAAQRAARAAQATVDRARQEEEDSVERNAPTLLSVISDPIGANVEASWKDGGEKLDKTPFDFHVPKGTKVTFLFTRSGYVPYRLDVLASEAQVVKAQLVADGRQRRAADATKKPRVPRKPAQPNQQPAPGDDVIDVGDDVFGP